MKLKSFQITEERFLQEVAVEEYSPSWFEDPVHRWLDIEAPEKEELEKLLEPLKIDEHVLKACVEPGSGIPMETGAKLFYTELPTQVSREDSRLTYVKLLCLPTTVVSIHKEPLAAISAVAFRLKDCARLISATTSALVYQIIGRLVAENFFAFTFCRQKQEALLMRLIEDADSVEPEDIFSLRQWISNISDTNEDHAFCLDVLEKIETTVFSPRDQREHLRELVNTLERHQRSMDRLEENVKELGQQFLLTIQDRTGNRLKILTILSAIFLPLTLIAGIYGMNFDNMPETHLSYGYYMTLGVMVFVAVGMLAYFYKKGWFD